MTTPGTGLRGSASLDVVAWRAIGRVTNLYHSVPCVVKATCTSAQGPAQAPRVTGSIPGTPAGREGTLADLSGSDFRGRRFVWACPQRSRHPHSARALATDPLQPCANCNFSPGVGYFTGAVRDSALWPESHDRCCTRLRCRS